MTVRHTYPIRSIRGRIQQRYRRTIRIWPKLTDGFRRQYSADGRSYVPSAFEFRGWMTDESAIRRFLHTLIHENRWAIDRRFFG